MASVGGLHQLIDTHYQALYRYAYRLSGSSADAEDLTQEAFGKALARLPQLRDPDRAKAWLDLAAAPKPKLPDAPKGCGDPVDKVLKLGRSLGVNSTPTLFLVNGERLAGGLSAPDLTELLDRR